ncbi:MAG TPA: histidine kinase dimerization/phospho-acceptor domain-containing protein, partial [Desulfosalsimonadaceae bacterium]|nr:histidine kinase dimerization/phospho-acceptor domain-containing protein [Desulfosalsimonadaceae bacterium]
MTVYSLPIQLVDMAGSTVMILLSLLCIRQTFRLVRKTPDNVVWTYLFWLSCCLGIFAVSRSGGHILKQIFFMADLSPTWKGLQPYSGTLNTALLIVAASVTLFFNRIWKVYQQIASDRQALQTAHAELLELNETLENRVRERTDALVRHEKQMAHADRLASIGQLSSGIAHEINNPLGVIMGYAGYLEKKLDPEDPNYTFIHEIKRESKRCKKIVQDLLNYARTPQPKFTETNIHQLLDQILDFAANHTDLHSVKILKDFQAAAARVPVDGDQIRQVAINLV